jgi:hypothetical protein
MAPSKKSKKKSKKKMSASSPHRKRTPAKSGKRSGNKRSAAKRPLKKKRQKEVSAPKKAAGRAAAKRKGASGGGLRGRSRKADLAYPQVESSSGVLSGDLQGISKAEGADSESVDELLEEGNPFEAGVVEGVENADDEDQREVHTHETSEDDVPDEYLDKD